MTNASLERLREIISLGLDLDELRDHAPTNNYFKKALDAAKLQVMACERILTTQIRVDESKLKRRQIDILPRLLDIIEEEKRKRLLTIDATPNPADQS